MATQDRNMSSTSLTAQKHHAVEVVTAINLTSAVIYSYTPGKKHVLTRVRSFCRTKAGAVAFVVKVGGRVAVAAGTFTAATEVAQALSTTLANLRGSTTEAITIEITTDGTGALVNGRIILEFRAMPMVGDAVAGDATS